MWKADGLLIVAQTRDGIGGFGKRKVGTVMIARDAAIDATTRNDQRLPFTFAYERRRRRRLPPKRVSFTREQRCVEMAFVHRGPTTLGDNGTTIRTHKPNARNELN